MLRPRIKRTTEPIGSPDGDVYLMRPSAGSDIRIEKPRARQRRLLAALDGERTTEELEARFGAEAVGDVLSQLQELEVVEDAADDERLTEAELARFDRQLRYFSDIGRRGLTPSECQDRLREARLAVIGVGGLGGWAAWALACCGIGEMWLVDGDRVEVSNLNRQILYTEADIGRPKVEAAAERLGAFNSAMRIEATGEAAGERGGDRRVHRRLRRRHRRRRLARPRHRALVQLRLLRRRHPLHHDEPLPADRPGRAALRPGVTGCFICQETAFRRDYPLFDVAIEQRRAQPSPAATLGPACGLIGGQVGLDIMHHLTGLAEPSTLGVAHIYDLRTMEVEREPVVPEPGCPVCGEMQPASGSEPAAPPSRRRGGDGAAHPT